MVAAALMEPWNKSKGDVAGIDCCFVAAVAEVAVAVVVAAAVVLPPWHVAACTPRTTRPRTVSAAIGLVVGAVLIAVPW